MKTEILSPMQVDRAAEIIKKGGLVAMPTETVYGLAADATDKTAIKKIYEAKGRPSDNPLIVHVSSFNEIAPLVSEFSENAQKLVLSLCPGPITLVMPRSDVIPKEISGGLDTVAIRMPSNPIARELIRKSGVPLAAPSANLSGSPSPTTAKHVIDDLSGKIDAIIDGGPCEVGVESTVLTMCTNPPRLLRPGGITPEQISAVIGTIEIDPAVISPLKPGEKVQSPGMKYKHYSPKARVVLIKGNDKSYYDYVNKNNTAKVAALCYNEDLPYIDIAAIAYGKKGDYTAQAKRLFDALRQADANNYNTVLARCPGIDGVGLAIFNRLIRAAGFEVIDLA